MSDPTTKTPVFRQAWLRVVLFGCAFCLITLLIAVPVIMALTGIGWQDLLSDPIGSISKLLAGNYLWLLILLEFVISLLSVSIFWWLIDRRKWSDLGWTLDTFVPEGHIAGGYSWGPPCWALRRSGCC